MNKHRARNDAWGSGGTAAAPLSSALGWLLSARGRSPGYLCGRSQPRCWEILSATNC